MWLMLQQNDPDDFVRGFAAFCRCQFPGQNCSIIVYNSLIRCILIPVFRQNPSLQAILRSSRLGSSTKSGTSSRAALSTSASTSRHGERQVEAGLRDRRAHRGHDGGRSQGTGSSGFEPKGHFLLSPCSHSPCQFFRVDRRGL